MHIWCSTKICCKVAFNDIHNKKEYSKSTIKAPRNKAKDLLKVNENLRPTWQALLQYPCFQNWTGPLHLYTLNRHLCTELEVQLIFQNIRRNKKVYTKCKSEKIPKAVVFSIWIWLQMLQKAWSRLSPILFTLT